MILPIRVAVVQRSANTLTYWPGLKRSSNVRIKLFAQILMDAGIVTTVRKTRGDDIDAACGQLAGEVQDRTRVQERMQQMSEYQKKFGPNFGKITEIK